MRPSYTKKKNGAVYQYYRCSSSMNPAKKNNCGQKYLNMDDTNQLVFQTLLGCAEEAYLGQMKNRIEQSNRVVQSQIDAFEAEVEGLESQLIELKSKQEKYLDSLITHQFTTQERQLINAKLEEFSLDEKQLRGTIYKRRFEVSQKSDQLISGDGLKKALIFLKVNYQTLPDKELEKWLGMHISRIVYISDKEVDICFKLLDDLVG